MLVIKDFVGMLGFTFSCYIREIANCFGLPDTVLESWLHSIVLRNICVHHCRLWNKILSVHPLLAKFPKKIQDKTVSNKGTNFIVYMAILYA